MIMQVNQTKNTVKMMKTQNFKGVFIVCNFAWIIVYIVALAGNEALKRDLYGKTYYIEHHDDNDIKSGLISGVIGGCIGIVAQVCT